MLSKEEVMTFWMHIIAFEEATRALTVSYSVRTH